MNLLDFIYPPICIHCEALAKSLFCDYCLSLLEPIDATSRCKHCFEEIEHGELCARCKKSPEFQAVTASVFPKDSPAVSLTQEIGSSAVLQTIASYLIFQFSKLPWDIPDYITFIPLSFSKRISSSQNTSFEIAKRFSKQLGIPLKPLLQEKQIALFHTLLVLRKKVYFSGKTILLITLDGGKRYRRAYAALLEGFPRKVYHLSFYL
ncbi:MAG TPA: double zinc ribbon domain-containing protein [Chlamydiales bacterium]|nr:double zinc ribbon domain-containing protein [Chlamydiales bacterium]